MGISGRSNGEVERVYVGKLTTTDAVSTAIVTFTIPNDSTAHVVAKTSGINNNLSESAGYIRSTVFRRTAAGGLGLIGETDVSSQEDVAGWNTTVVVNGSNIEVQVKGAAGSTVRWRAVVKVLIVT